MTVSIAFDTFDAEAATTAAGGTYTFSIPVAPAGGIERVVFLAAIAGTSVNNNFVACSIDGQMGLQLGSAALGNDAGGLRAFVCAYRAPGTTSASIDVIVTNGAGYTTYGAACACFKVSGASTVLATSSSATDDPTLSLNTATSGGVISALLGYDVPGGSNVWTGLTERFDSISILSNDLFTGASANVVTGETPRAVSVNISATPNGSVASLAVSFSAASIKAEKESVWLAGGGHLGKTTWVALRTAFATAVGFPLA